MLDFRLERACRRRGHRAVAGIDEAGRGPLAGPVTAAVVVLPANYDARGLNDSKRLNANRREELYEQITTCQEVTWGVAFVEVEEIDRLNILRATHLAMARAVERLLVRPDFFLIDGLRVPDFPWAHEAVVKGDGISPSIAAASILAKVARDRHMRVLAREFPEYGFDRHKGYGTREHLEALREYGPCRVHRRSFQPVAQLTLPFDRG